MWDRYLISTAQKAKAMATSLQLPNQVWASIFAPLPPKTLGICRHVCRAWNSILTDPAFISVHLDHAKAEPSSSSSCRLRCKFMVSDKGTVYTKWREEVDDEKANNWNNKFNRVPPGFPLSRQHSGIEGVNAIGVSGGIYCVQVTDSYHENVMVWNPSIRKCMLLQRRPRSSLMVKPSVGTRLVLQGFGFDPVSNDYKFVMVVCRSQRLQQQQQQHKLVAQVYSLARGSWTSKPFPVSLETVGYSFGVCGKGVISWAIQQERQGFRGYLNVDWRKNLILKFDIKDEVFGVSENAGKEHLQGLQDVRVFNPGFNGSFFEYLVLGDKQAKPMPWSKGVHIIDGQVLR